MKAQDAKMANRMKNNTFRIKWEMTRKHIKPFPNFFFTRSTTG